MAPKKMLSYGPRDPRYLTVSHSAGSRVPGTPQGDGPFVEWLNRTAPAGYRLVQVIEHPAWEGRPEMPRVRECLFEKVS